MDTATYESLIINIKSSFTQIHKEIKKPVFSRYFTNLLEDCSLFISQSLDSVTNLLTEINVHINQLLNYIKDIVFILQELSDLTKKVIELKPMSCSSMKLFPTVTGHIIMAVFAHCKNSESVYGSKLSQVQKQIKDLFRTCHELQLTYLMVLEKHYIFDLTETEEQDVLVEALDINIRIGEIVQSLDVKTMAEQWKAFTIICEKYADTLTDKQVFRKCTHILCGMVTSNIKIALEDNEEKIIARSLKVSSFILKILLKICIIFKNATIKDYDSIMELLLHVNLNNVGYLHKICEKSSNFITLYNNNITNPVNSILNELLNEDKLLQYICNYNINKIKRNDKLLGFIHLIISCIKCLLQKSGDQLAMLQKHPLINAIYIFLPDCHLLFNLGLKFNCEGPNTHYQTYGLYEHLLTHTVSLVSTMTAEEMNIVERRIFEAVLSTDCVCAMFSSNLWVILAKMSNRQLLFSQVVSLSKIYQKLEDNKLFMESPQSIHLGHTISGLFKAMVDEDKMKLYSMFNIRDEKNLSLWGCLKICNLPMKVQGNAQEFAMKQLHELVRYLAVDEIVDIDILIKSINLATTCSHMSQNDELEFSIMTAWTKACPKNISYVATKLDKGTLWYYKYIEALVNLTELVLHIFNKNSINLIKVLHIASTIACVGYNELKLLVINILCVLANFEANDVNKHVLDSILTETFSELFSITDSIVRNKLFNTFRMYKSNNLYRILSNVVNKDVSLKESWNYFVSHGRLASDTNDLNEHSQSAMEYEYYHKCIESNDSKDTDSLVLQKSISNNFDIDIDILFDPDSDEEPACKKAKIDDVAAVISRLETDTSLLCNIKENVFTVDYRKRIKTICNKLTNIID